MACLYNVYYCPAYITSGMHIITVTVRSPHVLPMYEHEMYDAKYLKE